MTLCLGVGDTVPLRGLRPAPMWYVGFVVGPLSGLGFGACTVWRPLLNLLPTPSYSIGSRGGKNNLAMTHVRKKRFKNNGFKTDSFQNDLK